jgi:amidohydrolase
MTESLFELAPQVTAALPSMVALRRDLHQHPELAFQEHRTAEVIATRLRDAGLEVEEGIAKTGVVGLLEGGGAGPTVAIRADIDGLPIEEHSDQSYASATPGVMHACGHDGHVAIAITLAEILARHRASLPGRVKFLFQPAEETVGGAQAMVAAGVLENPHVDAVLSLHLWNYLPVGRIGVRTGAIFSSADEIRIVVRGRGGHGALPHLAVDPVLTAAHLVIGLQSLVSREKPPLEPAVATFGMIRGGTAFNVIPEEVELRGTIRALDPALRQYLLTRVGTLARDLAAAYRAEVEVTTRQGCTAVVNDRGMTDLVRGAIVAELGAEAVEESPGSTAGDDVADFLALRPGCYFLVGAANPSRGLDYSHHHPSFDFDEAALGIAARVLGRATLDALQTVSARTPTTDRETRG